MCTLCFLVIRTNLVICIFSNVINASIDSFIAFLPYSNTDPRFPTGLLCVCVREILYEKIIAVVGDEYNWERETISQTNWERDEGSMHGIYKHLKGHTENGVSQRRINKTRKK